MATETGTSWLPTIISGLSFLAAAISATVAVITSAARAKEASAHAKTSEDYAKSLKAIIDLGEYSKHLRGMEKILEALAIRMQDVAAISDSLRSIARETREVSSTVASQVTASLEKLATAASQVDEIAKDLRDIANITRKSQRQSEVAHRLLLRQIEGLPPDVKK